MDKPPKPPGKPDFRRTPGSSDSFSMPPHDRETILQEMLAMETRVTAQISTEYGKLLAIASDHGERLGEVERSIIELRAHAIESRELSQEIRSVREDLRQHRATMDRVLLNDVDQERVIGAVRERIARQATEAGAAAGSEAGLEAASKGKTRQTLLSTLVAGLVSGIFIGIAQSCEHQSQPSKPQPTYPSRP